MNQPLTPEQTKRRRWRILRAKPGELMAHYGRADRWNEPDVCYAWGPGAGDGHLLHCMFSGIGWNKGKYGAENDGFLKELDARGYDLKTLKFSIKKKSIL